MLGLRRKGAVKRGIAMIKKFKCMFFIFILLCKQSDLLGMIQENQGCWPKIKRSAGSCFSALKYQLSRCMRSSCRSLKKCSLERVPPALVSLGAGALGMWQGVELSRMLFIDENSALWQKIMTGSLGSYAGHLLSQNVIIFCTGGSLQKLYALLRLLDQQIWRGTNIIIYGLFMGIAIGFFVVSFFANNNDADSLRSAGAVFFVFCGGMHTISILTAGLCSLQEHVINVLKSAQEIIFNTEQAAGFVSRGQSNQLSCAVCNGDFSRDERIARPVCSTGSLHVCHLSCMLDCFAEGDGSCPQCHGRVQFYMLSALDIKEPMAALAPAPVQDVRLSVLGSSQTEVQLQT